MTRRSIDVNYPHARLSGTEIQALTIRKRRAMRRIEESGVADAAGI
jgi:hypothetical protein